MQILVVLARDRRLLTRKATVEVKLLKQRVRDIVSPQRDLGHIDSSQKRQPKDVHATAPDHTLHSSQPQTQSPIALASCSSATSAPESSTLPDVAIGNKQSKEGQRSLAGMIVTGREACDECE